MASAATRALRVHALELLRQPGSSKAITTELSPDELGVEDQRLNASISVDLTATATVDSIVVSGAIRAPWADECRRCLEPVADVAEAVIDEIYQHELTDDEAFEISGDLIDLTPAVREHVVLALPVGPLCRPDCAGICPVCGADLNARSCDCDLTVKDDRWAALADLRLDDSPSESTDQDP